MVLSLFLCEVFFFLTGISSLLGPSGFWQPALPVGVYSLECNNNNNATEFLSLALLGMFKKVLKTRCDDKQLILVIPLRMDDLNIHVTYAIELNPGVN